MRKLLILQMRPEDKAADSEFAAILRIGQVDKSEVERFRLEQNCDFTPDLTNYSAIIAGGSPFDVSTPADKKSHIQQSIEAFYSRLFKPVIESDFPFLGACSGNGLLGNYCGVPITGKYSEPVGSALVFQKEAAEKDPLLKGLPKEFPAFVGHKEACEYAPEESILLMSSKDCPVQMYRIKKNIYATQFHPEADVAEIELRIRTYETYGYFNPETSEQLIASIQGTDTSYAHEVLRRFVENYHKRINL